MKPSFENCIFHLLRYKPEQTSRQLDKGNGLAETKRSWAPFKMREKLTRYKSGTQQNNNNNKKRWPQIKFLISIPFNSCSMIFLGQPSDSTLVLMSPLVRLKRRLGGQTVVLIIGDRDTAGQRDLEMLAWQWWKVITTELSASSLWHSVEKPAENNKTVDWSTITLSFFFLVFRIALVLTQAEKNTFHHFDNIHGKDQVLLSNLWLI